MFPRSYVPVVAMGSDDVESRHYADILRELFALVNRGRGFDFVVEVTDIHELRSGNWQWYEWGSVMWDCVCAECGRVFADTCPQLEICEECLTKEGEHGSPCADFRNFLAGFANAR